MNHITIEFNFKNMYRVFCHYLVKIHNQPSFIRFQVQRGLCNSALIVFSLPVLFPSSRQKTDCYRLEFLSGTPLPPSSIHK